jgi:RNA polymerase sigma-70 factor, ECF subfamily
MKEGSYNKDKDSALVAAVLGGQKDAVEKMFDIYAPILYGFILKRVPVENKANNILKETLATACKNLRCYNPERNSLYTWLMHLAQQITFKKLEEDRNNNLQNSLPKNLAKENSASSNAFDLVYIQGLSLTEASAQLGLPVSKIIANLRVAMQRLSIKKGDA